MTTKFYKRFFALLTELGIVEERAAIISGFTNGRTDSSRDLSDLDAALLIKKIENSTAWTASATTAKNSARG